MFRAAVTTFLAFFGMFFFAGTSAPVLNLHAAGDAVENPHWKEDGCIVCHSDGDAMGSEASRKGDALCLSCHDGRKAVAERHPVGRLFGNPQIVRPDGWPVSEGRLSCTTCHDVKAACLSKPPAARLRRFFLRGEVSAGTSTWCTQCHTALVHEKWNPHQAGRGAGEFELDACLSCHTESMTGGPAAARTGQPRLVAPEPALCLGCHPTHEDYFEPGHVGVRVTTEILRHLAAADASAIAAGVFRATEQLPLVSGRTVVCSTCHNPHERGVFPDENVLARGAMGGDDEARPGTALRLQGTALCRTCHGPAPEFSRMDP
jgi:hypothetical protein